LGANDGEQADFAWDIHELLVKAGWIRGSWGTMRMGETVIWQGPQRPSAGSVAATNVELHLHPDFATALRPAATVLADALNEIGITATIPQFNCESGNNGSVHVLIGPKS
jgi:hypothetical protein